LGIIRNLFLSAKLDDMLLLLAGPLHPPCALSKIKSLNRVYVMMTVNIIYSTILNEINFETLHETPPDLWL